MRFVRCNCPDFSNRVDQAALHGPTRDRDGEYLRASPKQHLDERISLITLPQLARLSQHHFCRAFKQSHGALGEVSRAVNSTLDLETVLSTIVAKAVQLSNTDAGVIYVFDELDQ